MMAREYEEFRAAKGDRTKEGVKQWHWREACDLIRQDMSLQQALDAILALRETLTDEQRERRVQARVPPD
jgi:hypothetical protein